MTKTRIAVAAAAGLLLALPATAASAAYEDDVVTPENVPTTVEPGGTLTGTVSFATDCVPWAATLTQDSNDELLGSDGQNGGTEFTFSIPVPDVEDGTVATLRVECTYDDGLGDEPQTLSGTTSPEAVTQASFVLPTALQTATAFETTITITADAGSGGGDDNGGGSGSAGGGSDASGALPDTGGSNASLLAVGGALVVAGAGVTIVARRRMGAKG